MKAISYWFVIVALAIGCTTKKDSHSQIEPAKISKDELCRDHTDSPAILSEDKIHSNNYSVTVTRTKYGVPHIEANDLASLAYGAGYTYAEDNFCLLQDQILKINSQRSMYLGPHQDYITTKSIPDPKQRALQIGQEVENLLASTQHTKNQKDLQIVELITELFSLGDSSNVKSDLTYQVLDVKNKAKSLLSKMNLESRFTLSGYVDGVNDYYKKAKRKGSLSTLCKDQPWLKKITAGELLAYYLSLSLQKSGEPFALAMLYASPPEININASKINIRSGLFKHEKLDWPDKNRFHLGSNGWAIGSDLAENPSVLANPHFNHTGNLRFYEQHIKLSGFIDSYGASIGGFPLVQIGFNQHTSWTHTVSIPSFQYVVYQLNLVSGQPLSYSFQSQDGQRSMKQILTKKLNIDIKLESKDKPNILIPYTHTSYKTEYGPIISIPEKLPWNQQQAYVLKDANEWNPDFINHWLNLNLAKNIDDIETTFRNYHGVSWVNTIGVTQSGEAFYFDGSSVFHLREPAQNQVGLSIQRYGQPILPLQESTLPLVDECTNPRGLMQYQNIPKLINKSYVQNSNSTYKYTNSQTPLPEYSPLYGNTKTPLNLRTRNSLKMIDRQISSPEKFSSPSLFQDVLFANEVFLADLILDDLIEICQMNKTENIHFVDNENFTQTIQYENACEVLKNWDRKANLNSKGAILFREFAFNFTTNMYKYPFNINDPILTPRGLRNSKEVRSALAKTIYYLKKWGINFDAELENYQHAILADNKGNSIENPTPMHGGTHQEGIFNIQISSFEDNGTRIPRIRVNKVVSSSGLSLLQNQLYDYPITNGSSWIYAVNFTNDGPKAKGLLVYSNSAHPDSPHYSDQYDDYKNKNPHTLFYLPEEYNKPENILRQYRLQRPLSVDNEDQSENK